MSASVFEEKARALAGLAKGAELYVEGRLSLNVWTGKNGTQRTGLSVTAWQVMRLGQIGRRKFKVQSRDEQLAVPLDKVTLDPANAGREQDGRFPGCSGNPAGKKVCTRHKATQAALALLSGEAEGRVELALAGDVAALRLCLERVGAALPGRAG